MKIGVTMATGISKKQSQGEAASNFSESSLNNSLDACFSYPGKVPASEVLDTHQAECVKLWSSNEQLCLANENRLYYGDNLPILASLLKDSSVKGKVRLIYIDPPFATKSVFQSRSQTEAYSDLLGGNSYIEFIRQRLILLRELLADDGSIYVHLDDKMAFYIKVIMDEIFGQRNFRNWITRKKCNPKNYTKKTYGNVSDFILFYSKSDTYVWNRPVEEWTDKRANKEYEYIEKETGRRYKKVPIHAPGVRNGETGKSWRGMNPPPGKHWQFPPQTLDEMDARGEIYWSATGNPRRKIYLDSSSGIPVQDIWLEFRDAHNQNIKITGYPTEKNRDLVSRIIRASSNPDDLVLDCFAGSGTTLSVASEFGRRWIGIDNSSEAIATTLRRFAKGCERMGDFVSQQTSVHQNPSDDESRQLSLFNLDESIFQAESPLEKSEMINNFDLYATDSFAGELENIVRQWIEWQ
ncbi:site-specific DNA-methyltransferase [Microcoleus sp. T2B6]|uniref:site-specific DNA-methyltransferase n=1 Tax=Microcoleus sp. T2B6 TaxID=3055424 RepID=UPI002FCEEEF8